MNILVDSYTEEGYQEIPSVYLPEEEYGRALQCFVPACCDVLIINREQGLFYLAYRKRKPMVGFWWIGGRMAPCETKEEAAIRNFKRETGLELTADRLRLIAVFDYRWKDREQEPQIMGCHTVVYTFIVELSNEELAFVSSHLDEGEYKKEIGLVAFNREQLIKKQVIHPVIKLYDYLFSEGSF